MPLIRWKTYAINHLFIHSRTPPPGSKRDLIYFMVNVVQGGGL